MLCSTIVAKVIFPQTIAKTQRLCVVGSLSSDIRWNRPQPDSSYLRFPQNTISYLSRCLELGISRSLSTIGLPVLRILPVRTLGFRWICHRSPGRTSMKGCPLALLHPGSSYTLISTTSNCMLARPYRPCHTVYLLHHVRMLRCHVDKRTKDCSTLNHQPTRETSSRSYCDSLYSGYQC